MVTRYLPVSKMYDRRSQANTIMKMLKAKNPTAKFRVAPNYNKTAFRVEFAKKF